MSDAAHVNHCSDSRRRRNSTFGCYDKTYLVGSMPLRSTDVRLHFLSSLSSRFRCFFSRRYHLEFHILYFVPSIESWREVTIYFGDCFCSLRIRAAAVLLISSLLYQIMFDITDSPLHPLARQLRPPLTNAMD
jgi:hypothetical protein